MSVPVVVDYAYLDKPLPHGIPMMDNCSSIYNITKIGRLP